MRVVIRTGLVLCLVLANSGPSLAQAKRSLICKEQVAIGLAQPDAAGGVKAETIPARTFSLILGRDMLNVILAGRTEFYECQDVAYRADGRRRSNTIKCQNATYFFTLDLVRLKFLKAQLNPEDETDAKFSYGSCNPI